MNYYDYDIIPLGADIFVIVCGNILKTLNHSHLMIYC